MKKLGVLVLLLLVIVAAGCSKDDTEEAGKNPTLTIEKTDYTIAAEGGYLKASFEVNVEWMASVRYVGSDANWLTLNTEYGKAGKVTLTMIAEPNPVTAERVASVRILYGGQMPCVLSVVQSGLSETDITSDFDPLFAQELQKRGYIADAKNITPEEVKKITELDVSGNRASGEEGYDGKLTSLRGIEYFESLTRLDCSGNQLTTLDVSKNTALTRLFCSNNRLTTLDVSKNAALTNLYCENNRLTTLDVSKNTALTNLYCDNNQLTTLDVSKNTTLTELGCGGNQLTTLDVSKNTALKELWCNFNQLTTLDVSKNTALKYLYCDNNRLITLDISQNTALTVLDCMENPGDGAVFPVTAWFDNDSIPNADKFTTGSWDYNGKTVRIDYRKAGTNPSTDITANFDPLFAQELQKRGYIADAKSVTLEEVKRITRLNVSGNWVSSEEGYDGKLTSLRGIEYFESLKDLNCRGNQLTTLDVSKNTVLTKLYCYSNRLTTLDVSKNTALTYLSCGINRLTTLDVSKNTALIDLSCYSNQLTSLDVSKNTALTDLSCFNNQLTALDVSKNTALTDLSCGFNQLTTLDVSKNTALTELDCAYNQLTALDISKNTTLTELDCKNNPGDGSVFPVTAWFDNNSIPSADKFTTGSWYYNGKAVRIDYRKAGTNPGTDITADFDPLFAQELQNRGYIADAKNITLEEVKKITELDVSGKWVSSEEYDGKLTSLRGIEYFESLKDLNCRGNQLTTLDVSKNTALTHLNCCYNQLNAVDVSKNTVLIYLHCGDNRLTTLDVSKNTALTDLRCGSNRLTTLGVSKNIALTLLSCESNQLSTLDISKNTALTLLSCAHNRLTTLDVSKNTALTRMDCSNNQLTTLDVSKNIALTELNCRRNRLTTLDISKNTALKEMWCHGNPGDGTVFSVTAWFNNNSIPNDFTTGSWSYNGKTVRIDYRKAGTNPGTDITAFFDPLFAQELQKRGYIADAKNITLEEVKGITKLDVSGEWNEGLRKYTGVLTSLRGIEYFESLIELMCPGNQLTTLDVSKNTALTRLECWENHLTTLNVSKNTALKELWCTWNRLTTLDVSKNMALKELRCGVNRLTALDVNKNTALIWLSCGGSQLSALDVSKNMALTKLECHSNRLTTLDVSNNTALTRMDCSNNQLTTLDVSNNTALTELDCCINRLTTLDVSKNTALTWLNCSHSQLTALDVSKNTALTGLYCDFTPGNGAIFPVTAWFDNNSIPNSEYFTTGSWYYNGNTVRIDYRKAE